ncbi:MAG: oxidoreductase [Planctomycetes bacterium RBG_13_63_9]|nr:MAG: oxidoreductase [Planctomycetes bacterium RBG_13_63_9]
MSPSKSSRRDFLRRSATAAGTGVVAPYIWTSSHAKAESKNDRLIAGCIGNGGMGHGDGQAVARYADVVAVCDVDRSHAESAKNHPQIGKGKAEIYSDYRKLLDRPDVDVVTISTPDHWHSRICIAAMKAGKDVYCQKPLTLTIDEGKILCRVLEQTGRVFQVGTQQRSENGNMFLKAVAMVQLGRIGKVKRVTCAIGGGPAGGPFQKTDPPPGLDWDQWLGQTPLVDYIRQRCHGDFRWWYEYSGGKMTDWGAHHVDVAQWAIGMDHSGPTTVEGLSVTHPVALKDGMPTEDDKFNTATGFMIKCMFPGDVEMRIRHDTDNGILFEGEKGRFFVDRGKLVGEAVEALRDDPLPENFLIKLRKGKPYNNHMGNFIDCVKDRSTPISDLPTHHRTMTTCHLANMAIRLGRKLTWDPQIEQIVSDDEANAWQKRPQRRGYEVEA